MTEAKIEGTAAYPDPGTRWVDNKDDSRVLNVEIVEPADRLGREIRGRLTHGGEHLAYATDLRTFHAVWLPLGVPLVIS